MANWSALSALGAAATSGGNYFGILAAEKTRTDRLAQARAEELADRANDRAYEETIYERNQADGLATTIAAEQRSTAAEVAGEKRDGAEWDRRNEITEGQDKPTINSAIDPITDNRGVRWYTYNDGARRPEVDADGNEIIFAKTKEAEPIPATGGDPENPGTPAITPDTPTASGTDKGAALVDEPRTFTMEIEGLDLNSDEAKTYGFYRRALDGQAELDQLFSTFGEDAIGNQMAALWRDLPLPRIIKNPGQGKVSEAYENIVRRMYTAFLRKDSGATLNDDEIAEMRSSYLIEFGNSEELKRRKMFNLKVLTETTGRTLPERARLQAEAENNIVRANVDANPFLKEEVDPTSIGTDPFTPTSIISRYYNDTE